MKWNDSAFRDTINILYNKVFILNGITLSLSNLETHIIDPAFKSDSENLYSKFGMYVTDAFIIFACTDPFSHSGN